MSQSKTPLKENSFDSPEHQKLFETGLEKRKEVVGEDYVERSLTNGSSDFLRPIQQYATVCIEHLLLTLLLVTSLPRSFKTSGSVW